MRTKGVHVKPQDVLVAVKIHMLRGLSVSYAGLGASLKLSASEAHAAVRRLTNCYLFDEFTHSIRRPALEEFLSHGIQYTFPAVVGKVARGTLTGFSAPFFEDEFSVGSEKVVWPNSSGSDRGNTIKPLYITVPYICLNDESLYRWMATIDILRMNRAREREVALKLLRKLIESPGK
jgi:hypothetical protein